MSLATDLPRPAPHLTPAKLIGMRFGKDTFHGIKVALVGYCPRPAALDGYHPRDTTHQYFIHVSPSSVQICKHNGIAFLSLVHVYGGPVSAALIEELAYYQIDYVLAYGLAGGLGTKNLQMGDFYLIERALVADGTTPHYTADTIIPSDVRLNAQIQRLAKQTNLPVLTPVQAWTGDAIYREYGGELADAVAQGCDIVNCDSSHLFAVSRAVGIRSTECGVLSDVAASGDAEWSSTLSVMLSTSDEKNLNPLVRTGDIVKFYVEVLLPTL